MMFRKKKAAAKSNALSRPVNAFDDPTSIGNVLLRLGKVTQEQLLKAVGQKAQFDEALLGTLLKQLGYVHDLDIALALKIQAEMRSGAQLNAELDVLQAKMDESALHTQELAEHISEARLRRRERGERSAVFLVPTLLRSSN
jgi:hypothetical protein